MEIELLKFLASQYEMVDITDFLIKKYGDSPNDKSILEIQTKLKYLDEKHYIHPKDSYLNIRRKSTMRPDALSLGERKGIGKQIMVGITTDGRTYLETQKKPKFYQRGGLWTNIIAAAALVFTGLTYFNPTDSKDRQRKDTHQLLTDKSQDSLLQIHQKLIDSLRRAKKDTPKKD